jgi:hypothetical protein
MGPSKAFRPIAPNGNSTDGRQTFFRSVRFSDVYRRSPNVWRRGQTFTQRVETWSDVHPTCGDVVRRSPKVGTLSAMEAWFLHAVGDGSLVLARCRRWKPGSCTLSAMEAWFLHAVGDDRSNIQPGPLPWGLLLLERPEASSGGLRCCSIARRPHPEDCVAARSHGDR